MGTNFYWAEDSEPCPTCGYDPSEVLHIGKSSCGWVFTLHVIPEEDIEDLCDWKDRFFVEGSEIRNEYGETLTTEEMIDIITNRGSNDHRNPIDGNHCIGYGEGSWDLITGEFS